MSIPTMKDIIGVGLLFSGACAGSITVGDMTVIEVLVDHMCNRVLYNAGLIK